MRGEIRHHLDRPRRVRNVNGDEWVAASFLEKPCRSIQECIGPRSRNAASITRAAMMPDGAPPPPAVGQPNPFYFPLLAALFSLTSDIDLRTGVDTTSCRYPDATLACQILILHRLLFGEMP